MSFEEYLVSKKINAVDFQTSDLAQYNEWLRLFLLMNPESFTVQKKFLLNKLRRKYLLT